jgi:hypothetical protein
VPSRVLFGFERTWFSVLPEPADAPVIPPVIVPTVHEYVLEMLAVKLIPVPEPLQIANAVAVEITGLGFMVILTEKAMPGHPAALTGVIV